MEMDCKLRMTTGRVTGEVILILSVIVFSLLEFGVFFVNPGAESFTFDLLGSKLVYLGIVFLVFFSVIIYISIPIYNSIARPLTFNKTNFKYKDKIYTYHQIEEIKIRTQRYNLVRYDIFIDGKKLYSFDEKYEGAKDFLSYLNYYMVPGTPRE